MTTLWLIRHAEADWNREQRFLGWSDRPLTDAGRKQAEHLHHWMGMMAFDDLYTSDLIRARETARIAFPSHTAQVDTDLRELCFGAFEGMTYDEAIVQHGQTFRDWIAKPELAPPNGEALSTLGERVARCFARLRTRGGTLGIIAHGGSLRTMLCLALGVSLRNHWQFRLDPCAITRLDVYTEGSILSRLNDTNHLEQPS
jgi:broad specificity phosphatase PhoE